MVEAGRTVPLPPPKGGKGGRISILSQPPVCVPPPPLSPCLFMDNKGEGDTRGCSGSSLCASPPTPAPSEGGGAGWGRGAGEAAPDLDAGDSGELAVGPVGTPAWRLDYLLHSA